jgi:phospholipid/cholesterol/gamma-HCH transport system substrate-binding protein
MSNDRKGRAEMLVGLFLLLGFGVLGILVVTFGRMSTAFGKPYDLTVIFQNVSGLTSGADVLLAGAKVGFIANAPQLLGDSYRVAVKLKVQETVKIPRKSRFVVGSSNLLGDKFIDVIPAADMDANDVWQPGEIIEGSRAGGFEELASKGGEVMDELATSLKQIQTLTTTINERLLNETNLQNLTETFANLKETSVAFKKASLSLDSVMVKVGDATERAGKAADSLHKATKTISDGKGPLGVLINDKETGENLRSLIYNMKRSGVLFYKDKPVPEGESK